MNPPTMCAVSVRPRAGAGSAPRRPRAPEGQHVRRQHGFGDRSVEDLEEPIEIVAGVRREAERATIDAALLENCDDRFVVGVDQCRDTRR